MTKGNELRAAIRTAIHNEDRAIAEYQRMLVKVRASNIPNDVVVHNLREEVEHRKALKQWLSNRLIKNLK